MTVSEITSSTKLGRAEMFTIIAELSDATSAAYLATTLREMLASESPLCSLFVLRHSERPTVVDAYTFDRHTAEEAHDYLVKLAA
jgi:hypothetical protein